MSDSDDSEQSDDSDDESGTTVVEGDLSHTAP